MSFAIRYVHTVSVRTYTGSDGFADVYADAVPVPCWCEESADLSQFTRDGTTTNAAATVFADLDWLSVFKTGSLVTLPSGRDSYVMTTKVFDSGGLGLPLDHIEVVIG